VTLPVQISPCPIVDVTAELRFDAAVPPAVAIGLGYERLSREFPRVSTIQTIPLPDEVRKANPAFMYQAQYRFESDDLVALLGPNIFAIGVNGAYTSWAVVSKAFRAAFNLFKETNIIGVPQRFGLKYMNFFHGNVLSKLNIMLGIADTEISGEATLIQAVVLSLPFKIQVQLFTDANITSSKLPIDPNVRGTLLSLDCFLDQDALKTDFLDNLSENLELAHTKEKQLFFRLLKDELLRELHPKYENEN
jgi:uncharacterized protein (TIGR04255 family)